MNERIIKVLEKTLLYWDICFTYLDNLQLRGYVRIKQILLQRTVLRQVRTVYLSLTPGYPDEVTKYYFDIDPQSGTMNVIEIKEKIRRGCGE